jgi:hypothetical protein
MRVAEIYKKKQKEPRGETPLEFTQYLYMKSSEYRTGFLHIVGQERKWE